MVTRRLRGCPVNYAAYALFEVPDEHLGPLQCLVNLRASSMHEYDGATV